ncbi:XRE family transcriptional regulator [Actinoplanes solisilvae]|uniref:XRE family transcriptional regulator n=1 Tax=Actinoplanes solisilvae TaxID=2486853 RepID=UPI001F0C0F77|nr:XRE family transcriptional regulator [Actinoplanes solisilvae]
MGELDQPDAKLTAHSIRHGDQTMGRIKRRPNTLLAQARRARKSPSGSGRPMSRQELADAVNAYLWDIYQVTSTWDETDIGRLERGENRWPGKRRREAFRAVLHAQTDSEIGFYIDRASVATSQAAPTPSGSIIGNADLRVPELFTDHALHVDSDAGDDWNSFSVVTSMLAQQRQAVPPAALLGLVEAHRECLLTLFRKAEKDPIRVDIGVMLGEASIVASRLWSAQGNRSMALAHCAYARSLADRLGSIRLGATARIFESNLHSGASTLIQADGDIMTGLRLLDEAAAAADHLTAAAQARIAAEQAQAYAALGLRNETDDALVRARQAASAITAQDRTGLFSDWNPTRVDVYEGTCLLLLKEPARAVTHLEQAATALKNDPSNTNVALAARVDLGSAYALTGHLDVACTTLGETYERLRQIGNLRGISRAQRAREGLNRWNSEPIVQELDRRMAAA